VSVPLLPRTRNGAFCVLDVTKWFGATSGGVRTYLEEKSAYVRSRPELRHVVVVPGERNEVEDGPGARRYRLRGPLIPAHAPYRLLLAPAALDRIVAHERPDVVEVGSPFLVPWIAARAASRAGAALVAFYHASVPGWFGVAAPPTVRPIAERLGRAYLRRLVRLFRLVVVASEYAGRDLQEAGFAEVVRIPLGVDLERFHPRRRADAERTHRALGLAEGPVAVFAGRIAADKHLPVLLRAWPLVERETGATLVLAGDGPEAPSLRATCRARRVRWLGHLRDRDALADVLAAADLYVSPSPVETFGLAPLEALACGTPVLSADRGAVPELVAGSGAGGLFRAGEHEDLAARAVAMLRAGGGGEGHSARAHVERNHAWPVVFDRLVAAYRRIAR